MANRNVAILKAVVCVAWADGLLKDSERKSLDAVLLACELSPAEVEEVRRYAATPKTLADLDVSELTPGDRHAVVQHAVGLAFADRDYNLAERQTILALCERLGIANQQAHALIASAMSKADRMSR